MGSGWQWYIRADSSRFASPTAVADSDPVEAVAFHTWSQWGPGVDVDDLDYDVSVESEIGVAFAGEQDYMGREGANHDVVVAFQV